jgi:DNA-binding GntR family transcriptional regulator
VASEMFQRPLTAQEAVLAELRRNMLSGNWKPGDPIRQDAVASELGVSRVPVREALKILEGEGQVEYRPHRGYMVTTLDAAELEEIYRIRELLEAEAVRRALPQLTQEDFERMLEAMEDMERVDPSDIATKTAANRRFHFSLFEAAEMPRLQHFLRVLWDASDPYRAMYYMAPGALERVLDEHRRILEACRERDPELVIAVMAEHRGGAVQGLRRILGAGNDASTDGKGTARV